MTVIAERAAGIAQQLFTADGQTRTPCHDRRGHVEEVVMVALRKTVAEAAKLVCEFCADDLKLANSLHIIELRAGFFIRPRCVAWPIWQRFPDARG